MSQVTETFDEDASEGQRLSDLARWTIFRFACRPGRHAYMVIGREFGFEGVKVEYVQLSNGKVWQSRSSKDHTPANKTGNIPRFRARVQILKPTLMEFNVARK